MLGLSRTESPAPSISEIDDSLASLVDRLLGSADPFDRLRLRDSIDVQLDRRLVAMGQGDRSAAED